MSEYLKKKASEMAGNSKELKNRLIDCLKVLKKEYARDFIKYQFNYEEKRLEGRKYNIQWVNDGKTSIGSCYLYAKHNK